MTRRGTVLSAAREVDQTMPQLEERWSTVTELAQNNDAPAVRGSEQMIHKLALEAEAADAGIRPEAIIPSAPVIHASRWLIGASALLVLLFLCNFTEARLLLHRFWIPGHNVSLTGVTALPAEGWVPKGEPINLTATLQGRIPKEAPTLFLRNPSGSVKEIAMAPAPGGAAGFQYAIEEVADSFEYRVRAGDGQTAWRRITAVERPRISAVKLTVTPPAYSGLAREEKESLPNAVRVLQGSELAVSFKADQPLDKMLLDLGNGQTAQLSAGEEGWYHYRGQPVESFTFAATALNKFNLENRNKLACRVSVYGDLAPNVKILAPSDDFAVLPGEKVNVTFEATDDFGLSKAELVVTATKSDGETSTVTLPVDLKEDAGKKQVRKSVEIDPKLFGLKHGDELSYVVKVTDTKQNPTQAGADAQALAGGPQDAKEQKGAADGNKE
ncbi:MAG: DUF4175 family protein, partial [Verrucomicrobiota bacterium]